MTTLAVAVELVAYVGRHRLRAGDGCEYVLHAPRLRIAWRAR